MTTLWWQTLAVAGGGALGSILRFWLATALYAWLGRAFPLGTLVVNVLGCFLIGLLTHGLLERGVSPEWRAGLLIGVLGGFTTFSTFSWETVSLLLAGETLKAIVNIVLSVLLCLLATASGLWLARYWWP